MSETVSKRHNVGSARWELTKTNDPHGPYIEVSQVLFRLSRWENLEYAKKI